MADEVHPRHPIQRRWARQRPALLWADRLTRLVVDATAVKGGAVRTELRTEQRSKLPRSLARTLRETAVMAHAGTVAACRSPDAERAAEGLAAVDRALCRLAVWLDLAQRFGDLAPDAARPVLDAQCRLRRALAVLAWEQKARGHRPAGPREVTSPAFAEVALTLPALPVAGPPVPRQRAT